MKQVNADSINVDLKPFEFRQGDVLLTKAEALPADAIDVTPKKGRVVLALGEATGHAHAFYDRGVKLFESRSRGRFLQVVKTFARLDHEEHSAPKVPPGIYRLPRQMEYTPRELVRVAD